MWIEIGNNDSWVRLVTQAYIRFFAQLYNEIPCGSGQLFSSYNAQPIFLNLVYVTTGNQMLEN
jgi:hypothetical protein